MTSTLNMLLFEILLIYPYVAVVHLILALMRPLPHGCTKIVEIVVILVGSDFE